MSSTLLVIQNKYQKNIRNSYHRKRYKSKSIQ